MGLSPDEHALLLQLAARAGLGPRTPSRASLGLPEIGHIGVIDSLYVRGSDVREFPKFAYKKDSSAPNGYITRVVNSQEDQDTLPKGWLTSTKDVHALLESKPVVEVKVVE
jgi:hypothetical protein